MKVFEDIIESRQVMPHPTLNVRTTRHDETLRHGVHHDMISLVRDKVPSTKKMEGESKGEGEGEGKDKDKG